MSFPHEYVPLPEKDAVVDAVNRGGEFVCKGRILQVNQAKRNDKTSVLTLAVPVEYADDVRGIKHLARRDINE